MKLCALLLLGYAAFAQQPSGKLAFEVVSVKPSEAQQMNQLRMSRSSDPGRVRYNAFSLKDYIRLAYKVKDFQVEGPEWIDTARFDVEGKLPPGANESQVPEMLQTMLEDRFHISIHRDSKEHAIFALVPAKNGPKLKAAEQPAAAPPTSGPNPGGGVPRGGMRIAMDEKGAHLNAPSITLTQLADMVSRFAERPVVDMSGIEGNYEFELVLSMEALRNGRGGAMIMGHGAGGDGSGGPSEAASEGGGSVQDALQRYGLKLDPRKSAMETIVVDHIEKMPVEN